MMDLDDLVLTVVFSAIFFYVLYGVIRAAVRDGMLQADERRLKHQEQVKSNDPQATGKDTPPGSGI
jgi:hypothetical protein